MDADAGRAAVVLAGAVRLVRTALFSAVVLALAVAAHAAGGGAVPGPWTTAGCVAVLVVSAHRRCRREQGLARLVAATLLWQAALHVTFGLAMTASCAAAAPGVRPDPMAGMTGGPGMTGGTGMAAPGGGPSCGTWSQALVGHGPAWMSVAHGLAAVAVAWWLRRGEQAAARLLRVLAAAAGPLVRWVRVGVRLANVAAGRAAPAVSCSAGRARARDLRPAVSAPSGGPVCRRGPPQSVLV